MSSATLPAGPFGDTAPPAPTRKHWALGIAAAAAVHLAVGWSLLPPPPEPISADDVEGITVNLAPPPIVDPPPVDEPPEPEPEPEPEEEVIQERAENAPPPAPPPAPRPPREIPEVQPQPIPEMWVSGQSSGLTVSEYATLATWLRAARMAIAAELRYPAEARKERIEGRAEVAITVDRRGRVISWEFKRRTNLEILDREVERTMRRTRRLPTLPRTVRHEQLSFTTPLIFEIVYDDRAPTGAVVERGSERAARRAAGAERPAGEVTDGLSVAAIGQCAQASDSLTRNRGELLAAQEELKLLRADYERLAERAARRNEGDTPRLRNLRRQYETAVDAHNARLDGFNADAAAFSTSCQGGRASWGSYRSVCALYRQSGNAYCEAFGVYWTRLQATPAGG